jgi:hypothetical protein
MNKRSAVLVASGLVLAMVSAAFGIMMGFTGPSSAGTQGVHVRAERKPVVKTVTDKRTIHKAAPGGSGGTTVVLTRTPAPPTGGSDDGTEASQEGTDGSSDPSTEPSDQPEGSESESPEPSETHSESSSPESGDD